MDPVTIVASITTLIQLATSIIRYLKTVSDETGQRRQLLATLIRARALLGTLRELAEEAKDEDWSKTQQSLAGDNGPLHALKALLEQMAKELDVPTNDSSSAASLRKKIMWPFKKSRFRETVASLEQLKSHLLLAITTDHIRFSTATRNDLREVKTQLTGMATAAQRQAIVSPSREQEAIVNSLSSVKFYPLENLSDVLDGDMVIRMKTNAEWLLLHDKFMKWCKASHTSTTLVLTGLPLSAGFITCHSVHFYLNAWHRPDIDVCVVYFPFALLHQEKLSESVVLSNIVQQMVFHCPHLVQYITALRHLGGPLSSSDSIDVIRQARRDLNRFYLILEGLDECGSVGEDVIKKLLTIQPPLNILIATQSEKIVPRTLQDCDILHINSAVMISATLAVVTQLLKEHPRIAGYLDNNPGRIASAAKLIVDESDGLLATATAMVEDLAQSETKAAFERYLKVMIGALAQRETGSTFKGSLNPALSPEGMFQMMLDDINDQGDEHKTLAKKTLKIMLEAPGPVRISELMSALAPELSNAASAKHLERCFTQEEALDALLSSCKGCIKLDNRHGTSEPRVRFSYVNTRELPKRHMDFLNSDGS